MLSPTVPIVLTILSDYFGQYVVQYLGTVDIRRIKSVEDPWLDKYHPAHFFPSRLDVPSESILFQGCDTTVAWSIWVATRAVNLGWKPKPGTPYAAANPTYRGLPFGYTDKKISKWLLESQHMLVDNPNALAQAQAALAKDLIKRSVS